MHRYGRPRSRFRSRCRLGVGASKCFCSSRTGGGSDGPTPGDAVHPPRLAEHRTVGCQLALRAAGQGTSDATSRPCLRGPAGRWRWRWRCWIDHRRGKDDFGTERDPLSCRRSMGPGGQRQALIIGQCNWGQGTTSRHGTPLPVSATPSLARHRPCIRRTMFCPGLLFLRQMRSESDRVGHARR